MDPLFLQPTVHHFIPNIVFAVSVSTHAWSVVTVVRRCLVELSGTEARAPVLLLGAAVLQELLASVRVFFSEKCL